LSTDKNLETDLAFGAFVVDLLDERVLGPDGPVKLGHKAFQVLVSLAEHEGRLLTKDALFASVWDGTIVSESALTSTIKELRRALGDESRTPRYIESVYGRGYRLIAPVRHIRRAARSAPSTLHSVQDEVRIETTEGGPPLVLISAFDDSAVKATHPHCAAELREEILCGLARFREIQLVADDRPEADSAHGRRSDRGYQLTARLLPEAEGVKILARVKRLGDGLVVWAETMSLADTGTAGGVERIVRRIVGAALPAVDEDLLLGLSQESGDLYDNYLLAKRLSWSATSFAQAKQAAAALESIIAEQPGFALAYAPLARLYNTDFGYTGLGSTGAPERAYALDLAKAGLAADRGNVHAYTLLGFCHLWHGQRELARSCFDQALTLNPYNHVRLQECATGSMYMGELAEARELMNRAAELNPLHDDTFYEDSGRLLLIEGEYDAALAALAAVVRGSVWVELYRSICQFRLGEDDGVKTFGRWRSLVEANWYSAPVPGPQAISEWIKRHHPIPDDAGSAFFGSVNSALALEMPTLRSLPKARA
jgi:DNA-binding winged helix-turn-helix (wHTH) protein/tetratricopeptide (TPR) repeat protein